MKQYILSDTDWVYDQDWIKAVSDACLKVSNCKTNLSDLKSALNSAECKLANAESELDKLLAGKFKENK